MYIYKIYLNLTLTCWQAVVSGAGADVCARVS